MKLESDNLILSSKELSDFIKQLCERGRPLKFTAKGESMSPFICNGDTIMIAPLSQEKTIETGDIVAYTRPETGHLIIHRIVKKLKKQYLLKGDNVYSCDGYYEKKDIHGYLEKIIIMRKQTSGCHKIIRKFFLLIGNFKKSLAFLSRHKILTPLCRFTNKVLNGY